MKKYILGLAILGFTMLFSCGSDGDDKKLTATYDFTDHLLDEISLLDYAYDETGSSYEIGWVFSSETGGSVIELGGVFPEAGTYTVTLWSSTGEVLAQTDVTATVGVRVMKEISKVNIAANTDYVISYNTTGDRDYYWLDSPEGFYPLDLGTIVVKGEVETEPGAFPGTSGQDIIVGVPEIGFVAE